MNELPEKAISDYAHSGAKAFLNAIPLAGGPLAVLFETVFSAPIDKRKEEWLLRLADTVNELCAKIDGLTPEKLSNDPAFISIYLQASNIAVRTHYEEKLKALNAAVKNSVLRDDLDETKKMIFVRIIDQMTPLHFKVLHFLIHPDTYVSEANRGLPSNQSKHWGDMRNVWDKLSDEVKSGDSMLDVITADLKNWGLVSINEFHQSSFSSMGTRIGREFSEFVDQ